MDELISRRAATTIPVMPKEHRRYQTNNLDDAYEQGWADLHECIENLPPANDKLIQIIEEGIKATGTADEYSVGMCNGMKWCKSLLDGKAPEYDIVQPKYKKGRR